MRIGIRMRHMLAIVPAIALGAACTASGRMALVSRGMRFDRAQLRVKAGQSVELDLRNADAYAHAFDIDALGVHVPLPGSQSARVTFTPAAAGEYDFYCGAPGHRAAGMAGKLVVEP